MEWQASTLAWVRPAQWTGRCHGLNSASVLLHSGASSDSMREALLKVAAALSASKARTSRAVEHGDAGERAAREFRSSVDFREASQARPCVVRDAPCTFVNVRSPAAGATSQFLFRAHCLTGGLRWVDVLEVRQATEHDMTAASRRSQGVVAKREQGCVLHVQSFSTGFFPASFPFAVVFSVIFAILPFFDHGVNLSRLQWLSHTLQLEVRTPIHLTVLHPGAKVRGCGLLVVLLAATATLCVTVWNVLWNRNHALNLILTVVTACLTLHSLVTLVCAAIVCCGNTTRGTAEQRKLLLHNTLGADTMMSPSR